MTKVALLGGSHFIGYHLLHRLISSGYKVTLFNRGQTRPPTPLPREVKWVRGDRNFPGDLDKLFVDNFGVVFDLSGYSLEHVQPIMNNHSSKIGQYIFCSTSAIYELPSFDKRIKENALKKKGSSTYGELKLEVEENLRRWSKQSGVPITILRPNGVIGAWDKGELAGIISNYFFRILHSRPIFLRNTNRALEKFVDVQDLAEVFLKCIKNPVCYGNVYNVAGDEEVSALRFVEICESICSKQSIVKRINSEKVKFISLPEIVGPVNRILDNQKIKKDLGISFVPLRISLEKIYKWLNENPRLFKEKKLLGERYIINGSPVPDWYMKVEDVKSNLKIKLIKVFNKFR